MAQETRNVDYESMVEKYMNEWDGLLNGETMVESKDYTIDDRKVGRPDLQKLQGALTDLPQIKDGIFTSATDLRDVFAENIVNLVMKCLE